MPSANFASAISRSRALCSCSCPMRFPPPVAAATAPAGVKSDGGESSPSASTPVLWRPACQAGGGCVPARCFPLALSLTAGRRSFATSHVHLVPHHLARALTRFGFSVATISCFLNDVEPPCSSSSPTSMLLFELSSHQSLSPGGEPPGATSCIAGPSDINAVICAARRWVGHQ